MMHTNIFPRELSRHQRLTLSSIFKPFQKYFFLLVFMLSSVGVWGQIPIPNTTAVTQNFDGMAATTTLPTDWRMAASTATPTWATASSSVTQQASSGTPTAGGTYNFGSSTTERAVGAMTSGGFASPNNLLGFFENTNASNLTSLTISYDAERYRINTADASVQFFYSTNGTTWTPVTTGDIAAASFPTGSSAYGFPTGTVINKTGISITGLNIATNSKIYLRWNISTTGGNSQGIAIDNISVTATFTATCAAPTVSPTTSTTTIATTSATLNGDATAVGGGTNITERGFQFSTSSTLASPTSASDTGTFGVATFNKLVSGLVANTIYYYRAFAVNDCATPQAGYSHTSSFPTFTTLHNAPNVGTGSAPTANSFTANWSAPSGTVGAAAFTYGIQVDDDSSFGSVDFTQNNIAGTSVSATGLSSTTTYYYRVIAVNAGGNSAWSATSAGILTLSPTPEIDVTQGGTSIAHNGTKSFTTTAIGGNTDLVFKIENTGSANLTFTTPLSTTGDYNIIAPLATSPVTPGNFTTFTVRFSPTATGTRMGTVTISGTNDSDEPIYTINLTGIGTPSNLSDVIANAKYTYNSNIDYAMYQIATITNTSNSIDLLKFDIRDGGGSVDADALPTILSGITFNVSNISNIRTAALFNGNALVNASPTINTGLGTIAFSGLSGANVTALDGGTNSLTLRVSFSNTVTDNQQIQVTIANADLTAGGSNTSSLFSNFTSVVSSISADRNRIEVTANRLAFKTQPTTTTISTAMTPAPTVEAIDSLLNRDLDFTTATSVTSTGTLTGSPVSGTAAAGLITFSDLIHTVQDTGKTLTATSTGLLFNAVVSNRFDITNVASGTYRTTSGGTWPSGTATWERLVFGIWTPATPAANSTDLLIIRHAVTSRAAFAAPSPNYTSMIVESGGLFIDAHNSTFGMLLVKNGGSFTLSDPGVDVASTGTLTVDSGGTVVLNSSTFNHADCFFCGTENFKSGSTLEIQQYDNNSSNGEDDLIETLNPITLNADGYYFGNLFINMTFSLPANNKAMTLVGIPGTQKLCKNDLTIANQESTEQIQMTNVSANVEVGGNLLITKNKFGFGTVSGSNITHTVKGNITVNGVDAVMEMNSTNSGSASVSVNLEGDLIGIAGTMKSTDDGCSIAFTNKTRVQNIDVVDSVPFNNINVYVRDLANVQLLNHDLKLNSNSTFTVENGGIFNFNYISVSTTPLKISNGASGTNKFASNQGSTLKITHQNGIVKNTALDGNVQLSISNKTFDQVGTFHYIGKLNQVTGDGISNSSSAKIIICDLKDNNTQLSFTNSTGITSTNTISATGGKLDIRSGQVIESPTAFITGSTGTLYMSPGTLYQVQAGYNIATTESGPSGGTYIPRMVGAAFPYILDGGTIELAGNGGITFNNGFQTLRGTDGTDRTAYRNIKFSSNNVLGTNFKNISSASVVNGNILLADGAIVDAKANYLGGSGTTFDMTGTSRYITAGTTTKPDAGGTYTLGAGTTVEFNNMGSSEEVIRLTPAYYNIVVSGSSVANPSLTSTPIDIQSGGKFTVTNTGVFKHMNVNGFSGASNTTISTTNSPIIDLQDGSTIEYYRNGVNADQNISNAVNVGQGPTGNYSNLKISGSGVKTPGGNTVINSTTTVKAGATFDVPTPLVITALDKITVEPLGNFIFNNDTNLMQSTTTIGNESLQNIGNIIVKRESPMRKNNYTYWSSPVSGQNLYGFSPGTSPTRFYYYRESDDKFYNNTFNASTVFNPTQGYAIMAPSAYTSLQTFTGNFIGVPNNGTNAALQFPLELSAGADKGYNMIGNPYPSNIDFDKLFTINGGSTTDPLLGNIHHLAYFWTNVNPNRAGSTNGTGSNYSGNAYAIYNGTGGIPATSETNTPVGYTPTSIIKVGQGFIVKAKKVENLIFNNTIRTTVDAHFFSKGSAPERDRYWLILTTPALDVNTILIGYVPGATNNFEWDYDAPLLSVGSDSFYSLLNEDKLGIQGRTYPLNTQDIVTLGTKHFDGGNYTISLGDHEGIFADTQKIYLKDKQTGIITNLTQGSYTFAANIGESSTRFEIIYKPETVLATDTSAKAKVQLYRDTLDFVVASTLKKIFNIELYDMSGRLMFNQKANAKVVRFNAEKLVDGAYILRVELEDRDIFTKKLRK